MYAPCIPKIFGDTIKLSSNELNAAGIDNIGKVEIYFKILDPDTFSTIKKLDPVTIKTSSFSDMDTTADIGGKTLYDENGIKIVGRYVSRQLQRKKQSDIIKWLFLNKYFILKYR